MIVYMELVERYTASHCSIFPQLNFTDFYDLEFVFLIDLFLDSAYILI